MADRIEELRKIVVMGGGTLTRVEASDLLAELDRLTVENARLREAMPSEEERRALNLCVLTRHSDAAKPARAWLTRLDAARNEVSDCDGLACQMPGAVRDCEECTGTDASAPRFWWCETCGCEVAPIEVTFEETHDPRAGGCGFGVETRTRKAEASAGKCRGCSGYGITGDFDDVTCTICNGTGRTEAK